MFFAFDLRSGETALISGSEIQIQESTVRFVAVAMQMLAPPPSLFQCLGSGLIWERAESPSKRSLSVKPTCKCAEKVKTCFPASSECPFDNSYPEKATYIKNSQ